MSARALLQGRQHSPCVARERTPSGTRPFAGKKIRARLGTLAISCGLGKGRARVRDLLLGRILALESSRPFLFYLLRNDYVDLGVVHHIK